MSIYCYHIEIMKTKVSFYNCCLDSLTLDKFNLFRKLMSLFRQTFYEYFDLCMHYVIYGFNNRFCMFLPSKLFGCFINCSTSNSIYVCTSDSLLQLFATPIQYINALGLHAIRIHKKYDIHE